MAVDLHEIGGWKIRKSAPNGNSGGMENVLTVADHAWAKAKTTPDAVAFQFEDEPPMSYADVAAEALALANGLAHLELVAGDTVSFQLPNWKEAAVINIAAAALGLVVNPVSPICRESELRFILRDSRSKLIFIPERFRSVDYSRMLTMIRSELPDLMEVVVVRAVHESRTYNQLIELGRRNPAVLPQTDPDAVKLVMYTSGTTGRTKGVLHSHRTIAATHRDYQRIWGVEASDVMFMPSPVTHGTGYILGLELPFFTDARVLFMDRWEPSRAVAFVNRVQATLCIAATVFLKDLIEEAVRLEDRLPSLRLFACGGAPVPPDVIFHAARVTERCRACRVYGLTEAPLITKGFPEPADLRLAAETDGKVSAFDVKIIDTAGNVLKEGEVGEILARGEPLMVGYTDPEESGRAFDPDGYFLTGDLGFITSAGALVITGRRKDLIIRGGENLSPKEIEDALERHPAVKEAAVVGMPQERLGEVVCAYLIVRGKAEAPTLMDLAAFLEQQGLARQKFPERLEYVDSFPRTPSGKVRKDILRSALENTTD
jgi:acyl-CoA synthetase